ncbi:unnamed protein product [Dibothriocephalus latus]|uniref:Uncharacterized protein n=1 Tax=Dibothriocephalus latus TaxID=60516 RepID=A0A3P7LF40_DIBLA|nr:unnamed protein product [Dibothriocephalus latus]
MYVFIKPATAEPITSAPDACARSETEVLPEESTENDEQPEIELHRLRHNSRCSAVMNTFCQTAAAERTPPAPNVSADDDTEALLGQSTPNNEQLEIELRRFHRNSRCLGIFLALLSGICYGLVFVPIIYTQENEPGASQKGIHYIGATGVGSLLASTIYFVIYSCSTFNSPEIPSNVMILPALLTGLLWTTGQACWLIANEALQASITFPIATTAPAAIVALIGTIFYHEVKVEVTFVIAS